MISRCLKIWQMHKEYLKVFNLLAECRLAGDQVLTHTQIKDPATKKALLHLLGVGTQYIKLSTLNK